MAWKAEASAGQLQLIWTDNSINEDGFKIERKTGNTGTYAEITSTPANATSYLDSNLVDGATYCYRVFAFNSTGNSPYSPEACGTAKSTVQSFALTVTKTGNGSVTSSPAGINCGSDCSESYTSNTNVALTATPAVGYTFAGWSGTGCANSVTMSADRNCTASFIVQSSHSITTNLLNGAVLSGSSVIWTATSTGSPVRVEFLVDGALL